MREKVISLSLIFILIFSIVANAAEISFVDVEGHWASKEIYSMAEKWVILGYGDGTFKPDIDIIKTHAFLMFARITGFNDKDNEATKNAAINRYANKLKDQGITQGIDEISFLIYENIISFNDVVDILGSGKENDSLTREEAAYIFVKLLEDEDKLNAFPMVTYEDMGDIEERYIAYVEYVNKIELMIGVDETHFNPKGNVTRAQVATILYRIDKILYERNADSVTGIVKNIDLVNSIIEIEVNDESMILNLPIYFETYNEDKKVSKTTIKPNDNVTIYLNDGDVEKVVIKNTEKSVYGEYISQDVDGKENKLVKVKVNNKENYYTLWKNCTITLGDKELTLDKIVAGEKIELIILNDKVQNIIVGAFNETKMGTITEITIGSNSYVSINDLQGNNTRYQLAPNVVFDFDGAIGSIYDLRLDMEVKLTATHNGVTKVKVETLTNVQILEGVVKQILPKIYVFTLEQENGQVLMMFLDEEETVIKTEAGLAKSIEDLNVGDNVKIYGRYEGDVFYPMQVIIY